MKKRLIVWILLLTLLASAVPSAFAETEESAGTFLDYRVSCSEANREASFPYLYDDDSRTRFTIGPKGELCVEWDGEASGVLISWYDVKYLVNVSFYSASGNPVSQSEFTNSEYRMFFPAEGANRMVIDVVSRASVSICELRVCAPGYEPKCLLKEEPVDLMLILSGVSDELELMGGLLPLYTREHGVRTAILYIGKDFGYQVQEAFRAFDEMGIDVIPVFLQRDEKDATELKNMSFFWKEATLAPRLIELLQAYKPKVVVTCDPDDSVSRIRVPYTGQLIERTIVRNADYRHLPVQKLYQLSESGTTVLDYSQRLVSYDSATAKEVAENAHDCYRTRGSYRLQIPETGRFHLVFSRVGEDSDGNDLFEHIGTDELIQYSAPEPTPVPTPKPTAAPTPEPTSTEAPVVDPVSEGQTAEPVTPEPEIAETQPEKVGEKQEEKRGKAAEIVLFAAAGICVLFAILLRKRKPKAALLLSIAAGALIVTAIVLTVISSRGKPAENRDAQAAATPQATVSATDMPTEKPATPEPTEEPTPEPTEEPTPVSTPTPEKFAEFFRQEGEPEEVVVIDYENGHWEYRSDVLAIIIDKEVTRERDNHPYCKYIAHVYMRRVNSFRSIVTVPHQMQAMPVAPPWRLARENRAVLAVTGDNLNDADVSFKGILLRNGLLYNDGRGEDSMVIDDDLTMRIIHKNEMSGRDLMDSGVLNCFSFGPVLVENGKVNPDANKHFVAAENPRCGVGMVEPGHFLVIVSDGRDYNRAYGYKMAEFAQIFADHGAQVAYNLDGGSSSGMVFMGEHINWHSDDPQRTWADGLAWGYSRLIPGPHDPIVRPGRRSTY